MLEAYAATIEAQICSCVAMHVYTLSTVHLSPNTGYVEGEITFVDASRLAFFTFLRQTPTGLKREKYRYHFMDANNQLIFRYDDAPHHPTLSTFPHHKHLPSRIVDSSAPDLSQALAEAETHVLGIP